MLHSKPVNVPVVATEVTFELIDENVKVVELGTVATTRNPSNAASPVVRMTLTDWPTTRERVALVVRVATLLVRALFVIEKEDWLVAICPITLYVVAITYAPINRNMS